MEFFCIYVTFKNESEAKDICRSLVEKRLIACANIFKPHTAIYEWKGPQEHEETAALLKSTEDRIPALVAAIKAVHSYEEPCIVTWKIADGSPGFLNWISQQTTLN